MHLPDRNLALARPPIEELLLVVAAHDDRARRARDVEHTDRVGTTRYEIADEDQPITACKLHAIEERLELHPTAVHVADDDGAHCQTPRTIAQRAKNDNPWTSRILREFGCG